MIKIILAKHQHVMFKAVKTVGVFAMCYTVE